MKYSVKITIGKMVKYFIIFILPVLVDRFIFSFPQIAQLTVSALLVGLVNFLKVKVGVRLP